MPRTNVRINVWGERVCIPKLPHACSHLDIYTQVKLERR